MQTPKIINVVYLIGLVLLVASRLIPLDKIWFNISVGLLILNFLVMAVYFLIQGYKEKGPRKKPKP